MIIFDSEENSFVHNSVLMLLISLLLIPIMGIFVISTVCDDSRESGVGVLVALLLVPLFMVLVFIML